MGIRLAVLALVVATVAQLANLWPLPNEAATQTIANLNEWKAKVQSEQSAYDTDTRVQTLKVIDKLLADRDRLRSEAWHNWTLWLVSAVFTCLATISLWRRWRYWRLVVLVPFVVFLVLHQPLLFRVFVVDGQLSFDHGLSQLRFMSQHSLAFRGMLFFGVVVPLLLATAATYAVLGKRRRADSREQ